MCLITLLTWNMDSVRGHTNILVFILVSVFCGVHSLTCVCDRDNVTNTCGDPPTTCANGTVLDACGCCTVCAKVDNERCGGPWEIYGKCADGFTCVSDDPQKESFGAGGIIEHKKPVGLCRETQIYLSETRKCLQELSQYYMHISGAHQNPTGHHKEHERAIRCTFKPQCTPEGWYTPRQCARCTDQCWCVDRHGQELSHTRGHSRDVHC